MRENDAPDFGPASQVAVAWDCAQKGHLWHSSIVSLSRVMLADWCINCTEARPGYLDPKDL